MPSEGPHPKVERAKGLAAIIGAFRVGAREVDAKVRLDTLRLAGKGFGAAGFLLIGILLLRGWSLNSDAMLAQLKEQYAQDRQDRRQQAYEDRMDRARDACITSRAVDTANAMVFHTKPKTPEECWTAWKPPVPPSPPPRAKP